MGFSNQERINSASNALQANVLDSNPHSQWYEKKFPFSFVLPSYRIWTQIGDIPSASNLTEARTHAGNNPTIIQDLSQPSNGVRLSKVTGTRNLTFVAYSTHNDTSSAIIDNWLQPQLIPQSSGAPSNGYGIFLYNGDPSNGGTLVNTTDGLTGSGTGASVSWVWNYTLGLLLLSEDFYTRTGINSGSFDPYITGFRYVGGTADTSSVTEAINSTNSKPIILDESVLKGDLVRLVEYGETNTIGRAIKGVATDDHSEEIYCSLAQGNQGDSVTVALTGQVLVLFDGGLTTDDVGKKCYLSSSNNGKATLTIPSGDDKLIVLVGTIVKYVSSTSADVLFRPRFVAQT